VGGKLTWYIARSSGLVAWALLVAAMVWGILLATRVLGRRPAPAWILSLHRYLGALAVVFVGVHVGAILLDSYTNFGVVNVLVPLTGTWHPVAVAWGIVAMYILMAVEVTSLLRRRLSPRAWRSVHLASYGVFALSTMHLLSAGTDVKSILSTVAAVVLGTATVFGSAAAWAWRSDSGATTGRSSGSRLPVPADGAHRATPPRLR
jgi:DMSO/TMAO reductase YedYZ heme-binding membrane subunit